MGLELNLSPLSPCSIVTADRRRMQLSDWCYDYRFCSACKITDNIDWTCINMQPTYRPCSWFAEKHIAPLNPGEKWNWGWEASVSKDVVQSLVLQYRFWFMQIRGKRKRFLSRSLRPTEGFDPEGNLMWLLFYLNEYLCVYKHGIEKRGEEEKTSASNQIFLPLSLIISLSLCVMLVWCHTAQSSAS